MMQATPMTGIVPLEISYAHLIPSLATVIDAFAVVLLVGVVAALLSSTRTRSTVDHRNAPARRGTVTALARSRTP